jgi:hypothetical protein
MKTREARCRCEVAGGDFLAFAVEIVSIAELSRLEGLSTIGLDTVVSWHWGCSVSIVNIAGRWGGEVLR